MNRLIATSSRPKPLAVGLVWHVAGDREATRRVRRVSLAAWAHREGYCLMQTFETDGSALHDELAISALIDVSGRIGVRLVLALGVGDPYRCAEPLERAGLRVVSVAGARSP